MQISLSLDDDIIIIKVQFKYLFIGLIIMTYLTYYLPLVL